MAGDEPDGQLDMGRLPDKNMPGKSIPGKGKMTRTRHRCSKDGESSIPSRADTRREAAGNSRTLLTPVRPTASS